MSDLFLILVPILLGDIANPVLFALLVYLAAGDRGALTSAAALLGHTTAYFACGIVIAFAFAELTEFMSNPGKIGYGLGALLGIALLWVAWLSSRSPAQTEKAAAPVETPASAFVTGAIVNFIGIPFGLPYFVAIDQILKTDLDSWGALAVLGGYNLAYAAPFLIVPVLTLVMGENARTILTKMSNTVERVGGALLPLILGGLGIFLIADAVAYFSTGEGLY